MTQPVPPISFNTSKEELTDRFTLPSPRISSALRRRIEDSGAQVFSDASAKADAGRDWWPLAIGWACDGEVPARPELVVRPTSTDEVSKVLAACNDASVPVTPTAGRSGVCGGSIPIYGGVSLDLTGLSGIVSMDDSSLVAEARSGTFGPDLENSLRQSGSGYTLGHWPQSMDISTLGGWLACRSAGQYSTRYGKIEDIVVGLEVVLADGRVIHTEGTGPRAATGPNLTQLFVGSEGTLAVITAARLRVHPLPPATEKRAYGFSTFEAGLECCRRVMRRGATPAVLRLYDAAESDRHFQTGSTCVLIVLDEADDALVAATMSIVDQEASSTSGCRDLDRALVDRWIENRNDVSALAPLWSSGIVVDTVEIAASWSTLPDLAREVRVELEAVEGTLVASVHQSHAYTDGACLYFTFAGQMPSASGATNEGSKRDSRAWADRYYRTCWDTVMTAVMRHGAAISHHHGIGLNRSRFLPAALGGAFDVLSAIKVALDPEGILNPGKLGFTSRFGKPPWP
ncbi:MAG: FAD-binding oxidoreductase [Actinobacteria bacterium]|nr:FAD-binding oxidoreductase [Actinomycetota bacterium]